MAVVGTGASARILLSNDFCPAVTKPNVELVTAGVRAFDGDVVVDAAPSDISS